jgi:hypothetical protein
MPYQVFTQDAYCFSGCLPDGYGPESNGDVFETREEAIEDAIGVLEAVFEEVHAPRLEFRCLQELRYTGLTAFDLPAYVLDEVTGDNTEEEDENGTRFVSISVERVES